MLWLGYESGHVARAVCARMYCARVRPIWPVNDGLTAARCVACAEQRATADARAEAVHVRGVAPAAAASLSSSWRLLHFNASSRNGDRVVTLRVTGETPPRIALKDFLECITDCAQSKITSLMNALKKELNRGMGSQRVQHFRFLTGRKEKASESSNPTALALVLAVLDLESVLHRLPVEHISRCRETGDLHRLQQHLRRETGVAQLELVVSAPVLVLEERVSDGTPPTPLTPRARTPSSSSSSGAQSVSEYPSEGPSSLDCEKSAFLFHTQLTVTVAAAAAQPLRWWVGALVPATDDSGCRHRWERHRLARGGRV